MRFPSIWFSSHTFRTYETFFLLFFTRSACVCDKLSCDISCCCRFFSMWFFFFSHEFFHVIAFLKWNLCRFLDGWQRLLFDKIPFVFRCYFANGKIYFKCQITSLILKMFFIRKAIQFESQLFDSYTYLIFSIFFMNLFRNEFKWHRIDQKKFEIFPWYKDSSSLLSHRRLVWVEMSIFCGFIL